jgi:hypothetical protein
MDCQEDKDESVMHETASAAEMEEVLGDALKDHLLWAGEFNSEISGIEDAEEEDDDDEDELDGRNELSRLPSTLAPTACMSEWSTVRNKIVFHQDAS